MTNSTSRSDLLWFFVSSWFYKDFGFWGIIFNLKEGQQPPSTKSACRSEIDRQDSKSDVYVAWAESAVVLFVFCIPWNKNNKQQQRPFCFSAIRTVQTQLVWTSLCAKLTWESWNSARPFSSYLRRSKYNWWWHPMTWFLLWCTGSFGIWLIVTWSEEVSVGFIPRWIWKGYRGYLWKEQPKRYIESYRGYAANLFPRFCQVGTNLLRSRSQISSHPQIPMEIWNDSLAFYEVWRTSTSLLPSSRGCTRSQSRTT